MQNNGQDNDKVVSTLISVINILLLVIGVLVAVLIAIPFIIYRTGQPAAEQKPAAEASSGSSAKTDTTVYWTAPDINSITDTALKKQVEYGKELIAHTAKYLGPNGSVRKMSNGMNCQNCHLQAGTVVFGNNYGSVASLYPKFRARSGSVESIYKRVDDCFERSLNGKTLDSSGKEMQAIKAYLDFLGTNVPKGEKAAGSGFKDLAYLDRAADAVKGQGVYTARCQSCHQAGGGGMLSTDKTEFTYPPLWGNSSFNDGAGLFRISNFAKYVKYNMPQGITHLGPQLSDEEAWDVAAFVLSQPRPHINVPKDWPDISLKPIDHPFGPYADRFDEKQHKYGPFKPIAAEIQKKKERIARTALPVAKS